MSSTTEHSGRWPAEEIPTDELAKRQGVEPIVSIDDLAQPDLWESEQESRTSWLTSTPPGTPT